MWPRKASTLPGASSGMFQYSVDAQGDHEHQAHA